jgi:streptogramin lyase
MRSKMMFAIATAALIAAIGVRAQAQSDDLPNPYRTIESWAKLADGRKLGQTISVAIDPDGKSVWVFERCGANTCDGSELAPIHKLDPSGREEKSFGAGMFVFPHGLHFDGDGNLWVTDGRGKGGKGQQVFKLSTDGKVLMTLGKAGVVGDGPDTFNSPSDALVAPNGDIFVADGHGGETNARIVKFAKDGTFIKAWGKKGAGPGEFNVPHRLALDSRGRLFVADRANSRIQIFDQDGTFLESWRQFGRPSGVFIDRNDVIYVADSESNATQNPGFKRGLYIGSAKDGRVTALIPDPLPPKEGRGPGTGSAAEGVAADAAGNIYGAEVAARTLVRYERH